MATGMERAEPPLVVVVGPTASGKTALAIKLAVQCNGEIICADSRTVYKGMDIGTAKPTADEQSKVSHWGIDLAEPGARFTAADFKQYALGKIAEIRARGRVPFLVGGAGLYVDGIVFDYQFGGGFNASRRKELELLSIEALQEYCRNNNIELPQNTSNRRHLIRAIEQESINDKRQKEPIDNTIVVGIATNSNALRMRITNRAEQLLTNGVVSEATLLGEKYGWDNEAMTGNVYPLIKQHLESKQTTRELKDNFTTLDWKLAKRQMTWFRRNPYIYWGNIDEIHRYVSDVLRYSL